MRRGKTRVGFWVGIMGLPFLILAKELTLRWTKKYSVVLGSDKVPLGCRCVRLPPRLS